MVWCLLQGPTALLQGPTQLYFPSPSSQPALTYSLLRCVCACSIKPQDGRNTSSVLVRSPLSPVILFLVFMCFISFPVNPFGRYLFSMHGLFTQFTVRFKVSFLDLSTAYRHSCFEYALAAGYKLSGRKGIYLPLSLFGCSN